MFCDPNKAYPIPHHKTWNIWDSTKTQTFLNCERMAFWEYICGIRTQSYHLVFGKAWHKAMEVLMLSDISQIDLSDIEELIRSLLESKTLNVGEIAVELIKKEPILKEAYEAFETDLFQPENIDILDLASDNKSPERVALALYGYVRKWQNDEIEVLQYEGKPLIEIAGKIAIGEYIFSLRMDSIIRDSSGRITSLEHKTGSSNASYWGEEFDLSIQTGMYSFFLHSLYPDEENISITMDGTMFKKTKYVLRTDISDPFRHVDFARYRVDVTGDRLLMWYYNILTRAQMIQAEFEAFAKQKIDDPVMTAFPMRQTHCHSFYGRPCAYKNFCLLWPNPLNKIINQISKDTCFPGFEFNFWDPSEEESKIEIKKGV